MTHFLRRKAGITESCFIKRKTTAYHCTFGLDSLLLRSDFIFIVKDMTFYEWNELLDQFSEVMP